MANELFGGPRGTVAYGQHQLNQARTAEALSDVAMAPAKQRLLEAQAGRADAEARKLDAEAQNRKRLEAIAIAAQQPTGASEIVAGGGDAFGMSPAAFQQDNPMDLASVLDRVAQTAAGAGMVEEAASLASKSALIRSRQARTMDSAAAAKLKGVQTVRQNAQMMGSLMNDVVDQESWDRAHALYQFQTGRPSPYAGVPYSPDLAQQIHSSAMSAAEAARIEEQRLARDNLEAHRKARRGQIDTQNNIRERRLQLERQREERLGKSGAGKSVTSPAAKEIEQAGRLIKKDYPTLTPADSNDAAYSIAAEARALRRANPALDASTAIQQAISKAVADGDFRVQPKTAAGIDIPGTKTAVYLGRGKSVNAPAKIPGDKKDLVANRYYVNAQGQVAQWTGKGFKITPAISGNIPRLGVAADPDDDTDEDDDTED